MNNYQQELKEALRRNRHADSPNKQKWKLSVLKDNLDTSVYVNTTINSSRQSRDRIERSLDAAKEVINKFHDFSNEFNSAIKNLNKRVEDYESEGKYGSSKSVQLNIIKVLPVIEQETSRSPKKIRIAEKETVAQRQRQRSKFLPYTGDALPIQF